VAGKELERDPLPEFTEASVSMTGQYAMTADLLTVKPNPPVQRWKTPSVIASILSIAVVGAVAWGWTRRSQPTVQPASSPIQINSLSLTSASAIRPPAVRRGGERTEPRPVRRVVTYPQLQDAQTVARPVTACAGRSVQVSLLVGEDGLVKSCRILGNTNAECAQAAREIAMRYRFKPGLDGEGRPVEANVATVIEFPEGQ
jgi:hypothetical protein